MMKQRIKKQFWFSPQEAKELKRKAKLCGITETAVIRILLRGYEPREKPDAIFYDTMRELSAIGNNINQIARSVNAGIAKPEDAKRGLDLLDQVYELMFRIANK